MEGFEIILLWTALNEAKEGTKDLDDQMWLACGGRIELRSPGGKHPKYPRWYDADGTMWVSIDTRFTTNLQCAVDLLPRDQGWIINNSGLTPHVKIGPNPEVFGETVSLAVCIANLEARFPWLIERKSPTTKKS